MPATHASVPDIDQIGARQTQRHRLHGIVAEQECTNDHAGAEQYQNESDAHRLRAGQRARGRCATPGTK